MALNFMMKIAGGSTDSPMPPGSILPFAGNDEVPTPFSWLPCNGQMRQISELASLSLFIGSRFTDPREQQAGYFGIPDLRGLFIRGVHHNCSFSDTTGDPDWNVDAIPRATGRELAPDQITRAPNKVGTLQHTASSMRNWQVTVPHCPQMTTYEVDSINGNENLESANWSTSQRWTGFGVESRPLNAAVRYIISTTGASSMDVPIGSIIATQFEIPDSERSGWLRCDGSPIDNINFPDLFSILATAWGSISPTQTGLAARILLPNSEGGCFLRGTDLRQAEQPEEHHPLSDPEGANRARIASKKSPQDPTVFTPNAVGTGTIQSFSTGIPKQWFLTRQLPNDRVIAQDVNATDATQRSTWFVEMVPTVTKDTGMANMGIAVTIPNKIGNNIKSIGNQGRVAEYNKGQMQLPINTSETVTKPKSVYVIFYIKARK
jgi:microcystin-dependent protein